MLLSPGRGRRQDLVGQRPQLPPELAAAVIQPAPHGAQRCAEQRGQLLVAVALQVEAGDHLAGGGRQLPQGGQDRAVDLAAGPGVFQGWDRLAPAQLLGHLGSQAFQREPVPAAQRHAGTVGRDRLQPGAEPGRVGQPRQPQKGGHGGFLGDVLGLGAWAEQPPAQPQHARLPARQ
jgi:hypothetical protein